MGGTEAMSRFLFFFPLGRLRGHIWNSRLYQRELSAWQDITTSVRQKTLDMTADLALQEKNKKILPFVGGKIMKILCTREGHFFCIFRFRPYVPSRPWTRGIRILPENLPYYGNNSKREIQRIFTITYPKYKNSPYRIAPLADKELGEES